MISDYYQRELNELRERGKSFARSHPALAPMLAGEGSDPDVERLLEGTAYLSALIHEKLDDELPEIIHSLLGMVAPHYLRPLPSATIMAFTPRRALRECLTIPVGTELHSADMEGTVCRFTTTSSVQLAPLSLTDVRLDKESHGQGRLVFSFATLNRIPLSVLGLTELRLHFSGPYPEAASRLMICCRHCRSVRLVTEDAQPRFLSPSCLRMAGFDSSDALLPYPPQSFPGFRYIQEFFLLPERFCFMDVQGLGLGASAGTTFSLELEVDNLLADCPSFASGDVRLFACPAINIFPMAGEPIRLDHTRDQYRVRPSGSSPRHYQVYSVRKVTGLRQGESTPRPYRLFMAANPSSSPDPVYALSTHLTQDGQDLLVQIAVGRDHATPAEEVLSLDLLCTNGRLPERLHAGDICRASDSSPELADFANLRQPTSAALPPLGGNTLWRLLSHLFLNYLSVATAENLRSLLKLYVFGKNSDSALQAAHIGRVDGIEEMQVSPTTRLHRGQLLRGQDIFIRLRRENFAGDGDMYVFGSVLSCFLASYAAVNTFTRLHIADTTGRLDLRWPAMLGLRALL